MNKVLVSLIIICLIGGAGVSYVLDYAIFQPRILDLESDLSEAQYNISSLELNLSEAQLNISSLKSSLSEAQLNISRLQSENLALRASYENLSAEYEKLYDLYHGIVWQYGDAIAAVSKKLIHPRYAEETPNETVLISDYEGNRVFEVNKETYDTIWEYAGVNGSCGAHRLDNGNTLIADWGNNRTIEVNRDGNIVWSYNVMSPYDAVKIDDYIVMTAGFQTGSSFIRKISYSNKSLIWQINKSDSNPTSIFVLAEQHRGKPAFNGGDYIIGYEKGKIEEIKDQDQSVTWSYGTEETKHAYDRVGWVAGTCMGFSDINALVLFIADADYGRVFAINKDKETVWQYGWSYKKLRPSPILITPDSVRITNKGNLLIADSGGSKVIEIVIKQYDIPREWADLFSFMEIRDTNDYHSLVSESGWQNWGTLVVWIENTLDKNVYVQVEASNSGEFWTKANVGDPVIVEAGTSEEIVIEHPIRFLRLRATCFETPTSGNLFAIVQLYKC